MKEYYVSTHYKKNKKKEMPQCLPVSEIGKAEGFYF